MNKFTVLALFALCASALFAGSPEGKGNSNEAFEKLKSLQGTWKGATKDGNPITISYRVVSNGSVVMETDDMHENESSMITMYHLDGGKLMMTHYCSVGNQPRMATSGLTPDGKLAFSFVSGTNMKKSDTHMHALTISFIGKDKITQDWTLRAGGKDEIHTMELTRAN